MQRDKLTGNEVAGEQILLVEDEPLIAMALEACFEEHGYQTSIAADGHAALSQFERDLGRFNCLVTDIQMPGMDGWKLAHRVRELRPDIPVIYTTGDSDGEWTTKGVPGSVILSKPFNLDEAVRCVAAALRQST